MPEAAFTSTMPVCAFTFPVSHVSVPLFSSPRANVFAPVPVNPADFLDTFQSVGAAMTEVGTETLRGVEVVHYVVTFDIEDLIRQVDPEQLADLESFGQLPFDELPMDIWISDDGLVHRFEIGFDSAELGGLPDGDFGSLLMRFDIFDHNQPVDIEAPPADQVTDGSELVGIFEI